jgi:EAL domain-containing protein (putative c-di-GMP-specific phosphodiesterase class I)
MLSYNEGRIAEAGEDFRVHEGETCKLCHAGPEVAFSMAFQPIVDVKSGGVMAYEALARGVNGEAASTVLEHTLHNNRYSIDQRCREKAIGMAATLGMLDTAADLSVNFYPNAVYEPKQCLRRTLAAASAVRFPLERIIFEVTEVEKVRDQEHLSNIMREYRSHGLRVAIDDFGAGHSGLSLLAKFQPDIIKIDRELVECIHERPASRRIVRSIVEVCEDMGIVVIAEGIEREEEMRVLCDLKISLMQGFYFARPSFEALPVWPATGWVAL